MRARTDGWAINFEAGLKKDRETRTACVWGGGCGVGGRRRLMAEEWWIGENHAGVEIKRG